MSYWINLSFITTRESAVSLLLDAWILSDKNVIGCYQTYCWFQKGNKKCHICKWIGPSRENKPNQPDLMNMPSYKPYRHLLSEIWNGYIRIYDEIYICIGDMKPGKLCLGLNTQICFFSHLYQHIIIIWGQYIINCHWIAREWGKFEWPGGCLISFSLECVCILPSLAKEMFFVNQTCLNTNT